MTLFLKVSYKFGQKLFKEDLLSELVFRCYELVRNEI
jgi:hypothetical protein